MLDLTPSRRQFLAALGVAALGVACTKKPKVGNGPAAVSGSIDDVTSGDVGLSLLTGNDIPDDPLPTGKARFAFALTTSAGGVLTGGSPQVYAAKDRTSKALGPSCPVGGHANQFYLQLWCPVLTADLAKAERSFARGRSWQHSTGTSAG